MAPKRTFEDLTISWPGSQLLIFNGSTPTVTTPLCRIPLSFLESCGVPDVRSLVRTIGEAAIKEPVQLRDKNGHALDDIDVFTIGSLFVHPVDPNTTAVTVIEFPAGKSKHRLPNLNASESTFSNSSHVSSRSGQATFRSIVGVRDQECLLSGFPYEYATASHLAPVSRSDVYANLGVVSRAADAQLYRVSFGALLRSDIHHAYDRYELSFFVEDGVYYVHHFTKLPQYRAYHGRAIVGQTRWPRHAPHDWPNAKLLRWHYQQCIIANFCV